MRILLVICCSVALMGQEYIDNILDRDPFDPERGQETDEVEVVEPVVVERNLPVLDGTLIIGEKRIALFSFLEEGRPTTERVLLNETVAGYKLVTIDRSFVELDRGAGPIKLELYSGQKKNRGGSKESAKGSSEPKLITTESDEKRKEAVAKKPNPQPMNPKPSTKTRFRTRTSSDPSKRSKTIKDDKF